MIAARQLPIVFAAALAAAGTLCAAPAPAETAGQPRVAVCLPPQAGVLEALLPGNPVFVLIDKGQNPHSFDPSPHQLARLAECGLYFSSGLPFERALLGRLRSLNPALRTVAAPEDHDHDEDGDDDEHDPHFWTHPGGILSMARAMAAALSESNPEASAALAESLAAFEARVGEVDADLARRLAPLRGRAFLVYHPAWSHFAERYGLRQLAVERHGGAPSAKHLASLTERVGAEGLRAILVQSDSEAVRARPLADPLGLEILRVNPLGRDPLETLKETARAVEKATRGD